ALSCQGVRPHQGQDQHPGQSHSGWFVCLQGYGFCSGCPPSSHSILFQHLCL
ncbi:hypothetical protein FRC18_007482, partial [Serendipita sp. 400]